MKLFCSLSDHFLLRFYYQKRRFNTLIEHLIPVLLGFFVASCSQNEEVFKAVPANKTPLEIPVEPPVPDSLVLTVIDFKTDLQPHSSTPIFEFQRGEEPAGEYLYRATVNVHQLGGDKQNLDILLYHDTVLVFRDTYTMRDTINHIMSISLARQITTPSFNRAAVRVTNTGDSISYGVEIKKVTIEVF